MTVPWWWLLIPFTIACVYYVYSPMWSDKWKLRASFKCLPMVILVVWCVEVGRRDGGLVDPDGVGTYLFWGMVCSLVGDLGLAVPKGGAVGVLAFGAAQVLYIIMFEKMSTYQRPWVPVVALLCLVQIFIFFMIAKYSNWFEPVPLKVRLFLPVVFLYFLLVPTMAGFACGTFASPSASSAAASVGGLLFLLSDNLILLGAFLMFTKSPPKESPPQDANHLPQSSPSSSEKIRRAAVISTYYAAQVLIGLSVAWY
eukprot:TRINITY_DN123_c9_g1_i1.p1 TRINITY_DN123_c9_g1~~TRINITY_DN123_c9_g1_i1.p1  ORF type:complete len:255 (+),score=19.02 TRINITY_DN123_c9_g1_i1:57-821(+)